MQDILDCQMADAPLVDVVRYNPLAGTTPLGRITPKMCKDWPLPPGFASLVHHETRIPLDGAFEYLLSQYDRHEYAANTNRCYAYALKPAMEALLIEGRPYDYLDDDVTSMVVSALLGTVNRKGLPLSGATIAFYVETIGRCAKYTNKIGMTDIHIDVDAHVARGWGVASMRDAAGGRIDPFSLTAARRHMIRPLTRGTIARIERKLLMDPAKWHKDGPSSRPGVTFANGRRIGLRLIENTGLMLEDVRRHTVLDRNREYQLPVWRTKGADYRMIFVDGRDLLRWQAYAAHERAACVKAAKAIHGNNWDEPPQLLLNGLAAGIHVGEAVQPSSIQNDFRQVLERLGMVELIEVPDGAGGKRVIRVMWHCYHDLRHTAAYDMYRIAKLRDDEAAADPVSFVQLRLGHAHRSTTARIYLWPDLRKLVLVGDHAVAGNRALIDA